MYERFTDRARKVMQLANQEAQRFNHEYVGTEHILLGIIKEGSNNSAQLLAGMDIDLRKVRLEVEKRMQHGPDQVNIVGKLPQTPRAKRVIELSIEAAREYGQNYVGTEHMLMGLIREKEGSAAMILADLGATEETFKQFWELSLGKPLAVELQRRQNLREQIEQAISDQNFEQALRLKSRLDAISKSPTKTKIQQDTDNLREEKIRKITCVLLLKYTGGASSEETLNDIQDILDE